MDVPQTYKKRQKPLNYYINKQIFEDLLERFSDEVKKYD